MRRAGVRAGARSPPRRCAPEPRPAQRDSHSGWLAWPPSPGGFAASPRALLCTPAGASSPTAAGSGELRRRSRAARAGRGICSLIGEWLGEVSSGGARRPCCLPGAEWQEARACADAPNFQALEVRCAWAGVWRAPPGGSGPPLRWPARKPFAGGFEAGPEAGRLFPGAALAGPSPLLCFPTPAGVRCEGPFAVLPPWPPGWRRGDWAAAADLPPSVPRRRLPCAP